MFKKFAVAMLTLVLLAGLGLAAGPMSETPTLSEKMAMPELVIPPALHLKSAPKTWHLQEGFEGTFLPTGWDTTRLGGTYANFVSQVSAGTYPTCTPHTGTYMVKYNCFSGTSGNRVRLATPPVIINSTNDSLSFWMTHDPGYSTANDRIVVEIMSKPAAGAWGPWTAVDSFSRYQAALVWAYHAVNLGGYNGDSVRVALTGHSVYGNNMFLDDVAVGSAYVPVADDIGVQSIDAPSTTIIQPGVVLWPAFTVRNFGINPETGFLITYQIHDSLGTEVYNQTGSYGTADTLLTDSTWSSFFGPTFTPDSFMRYRATAYTTLTGDLYALNDTLTFDFRTWDRDVAVTAINVPAGNINPDITITPQVTYHNAATETADFTAHLRVDFGANVVYEQSVPVTGLAGGGDITVDFPAWPGTRLVGTHTVTASAVMDHDLNLANNTMAGTFNSNYSIWATWTPMDVGAYSQMECGWQNRLYVIGGTNAILWYDTLDASWYTSTRTLPSIMMYGQAVTARGYIYVLGGMSTWAAGGGLTTVVKYLPDLDSLETMTPLPTVAADFGAGVWRDSLIYRLGGGNWSGGAPVVSTVEVYDVVNNSWATATSLPAVVGCNTASIIGDTIVVSTGRTAPSTYSAVTYIGVIDPANPTSIAWSTGAAYPGGAIYRAEGTAIKGEHYLVGGQNAGGSYATCYSYSPGSNTWTVRPSKTTATSNVCGAAAVGDWLAIAGGYNGSATLANTEALFLGSAASANPMVTAASPADGASKALPMQPIVITFSKSMDSSSITWLINPDPGGWSYSWNSDYTQFTARHARFDYATPYTVTITGGQSLDGYALTTGTTPNPFTFTTWALDGIIMDQSGSPTANAYATQIFYDFPTASCYLADDINVTGLDSIQIQTVSINTFYWNGHTNHPLDSVYVAITSDSSDYPAFSQVIWAANLATPWFDESFSDGTHSLLSAYRDPALTLAPGKYWLICAPYMSFGAKDGQFGWMMADTIRGTEASWINPGNYFGNGTDWQRASILASGTPYDLQYTLRGQAYTGVAGNPVEQPKPMVFALRANYPNPASGQTTFSFSLPKAQEYSLKVYNIAGQLVHSINNSGKAGMNNIAWNAGKIAGGVYFYTLSSGGKQATRKLVVIK